MLYTACDPCVEVTNSVAQRRIRFFYSNPFRILKCGKKIKSNQRENLFTSYRQKTEKGMDNSVVHWAEVPDFFCLLYKFVDHYASN